MIDRYRILIVHPTVVSTGGPDQCLYGLVLYLANVTSQIYLVVPENTGVVAKYTRFIHEPWIDPNAGYYHNFRYVRSNTKLLFRNLAAYPIIRKSLTESKIDLVHTNVETAWIYGLAARSLGIPSIIHLHGLTTIGTKIGARLMPGILRRCADHLIAVSKPAADAFIQVGIPGGMISVVENGVDIGRFQPDVSEKRDGDPAGRFFIGAVGAADPRKGWHNLVNACAILKQKYPNLRCLFVGDLKAGQVKYQGRGTYHDALLRLVTEHGLQDMVEFTGVIEEMPGVYAGLDLLVQPSEIEAGPRAPIEAMACGIPVVATRVGGNSDYVQNGVSGVLCSPDDTQALANAIDCLLSDRELRRRMGIEGRRIALERFSLEAHAQKVQAIYYQLLHSSN